MAKKNMKIGILTAGGDCPGINAAIRGVGKTAILEYGMQVIGISSGFLGLINEDYVEITDQNLSGILTIGGTVLGTSREKPFKKNSHLPNQIDKPKLIKKHYHELGLDCLVCIGGNGTQQTAYLLSEEGLNIVGIPKTIDNDVWGTDITFGFDSAVNIGVGRVQKWLPFCKTWQELINERRQHYSSIILKNPTLVKYASGWENRVKDLENFIERG